MPQLSFPYEMCRLKLSHQFILCILLSGDFIVLWGILQLSLSCSIPVAFHHACWLTLTYFATFTFMKQCCHTPLYCIIPYIFLCRNLVSVHYAVSCHIHFDAETMYQSIMWSHATSTFIPKPCISPLCCLMLHPFSCTNLALFHYVIIYYIHLHVETLYQSIILSHAHPFSCTHLVSVDYDVSCHIRFHVQTMYYSIMLFLATSTFM